MLLELRQALRQFSDKDWGRRNERRSIPSSRRVSGSTSKARPRSRGFGITAVADKIRGHQSLEGAGAIARGANARFRARRFDWICRCRRISLSRKTLTPILPKDVDMVATILAPQAVDPRHIRGGRSDVDRSGGESATVSGGSHVAGRRSGSSLQRRHEIPHGRSGHWRSAAGARRRSAGLRESVQSGFCLRRQQIEVGSSARRGFDRRGPRSTQARSAERMADRAGVGSGGLERS